MRMQGYHIWSAPVFPPFLLYTHISQGSILATGNLLPRAEESAKNEVAFKLLNALKSANVADVELRKLL